MVASARYCPAQHGALAICAASAAADLLRPSAEEASPDIRTSDAHRHATVADDELSSARPSCLSARFDSHRPARRIRLLVSLACLRPR